MTGEFHPLGVLILTPERPAAQLNFFLFFLLSGAYSQTDKWSNPMWQLKTADRGEPWTHVDTFDSVTAAARRIVELEGYPVSAVFFELLIETKAGNEDDAFAHLEHTGRTTERFYVVKRVRH
jgi:hypothetical protein